MQELIERIAKSLVDRPEEVRVHETGGATSITYKLVVGDGEMGQIIGHNGRNIGALRTIISSIAAKEGKRVVLELDE